MPADGKIAIGTSGTAVLSRMAVSVGTIPARIGNTVHQVAGRRLPVIRRADVTAATVTMTSRKAKVQPQRPQHEADDQAHHRQLHHRADGGQQHVPGVDPQPGEAGDERSGRDQQDQ